MTTRAYLRWWTAAALCMALFTPAWAQQPAQAPKAASSTPASAKPQAAGTVDLLSGTVTVTTSRGTPRNITVGMAIEEGDTIATKEESEVHATMADGAYLAVRANSKIKITAYAANGNASDRSWIDLVTGSLRTVTGWIAKSRPKAYRIVTPTATVGVRGTDHEVVYLTEEEAETPEEAGTYNVVFEGATTLETPKGSVNVQVGQAAFILPKEAIPQLYARELPVFLVRARGQYDNDVVQHRINQDSIMQRGLIDRGLMREGQNLQDVFRRIGGEGFIPGASIPGSAPGSRPTAAQQEQRLQQQMRGAQSEIFKQTFGGPGNTKEPLPTPFGLPGAGNTNAPPPLSIPAPGGGSGGGGGGGVPAFPTR